MTRRLDTHVNIFPSTLSRPLPNREVRHWSRPTSDSRFTHGHPQKYLQAEIKRGGFPPETGEILERFGKLNFELTGTGSIINSLISRNVCRNNDIFLESHRETMIFTIKIILRNLEPRMMVNCQLY